MAQISCQFLGTRRVNVNCSRAAIGELINGTYRMAPKC